MTNRGMRACGLIVLGLAGFQACPAHAQTSSGSQDIQVYGGEIFGDRLLEAPLSGSRARLDDDATFGARYTYHFAEEWGVQLQGGYSPSRAAYVASGGTNVALTTSDLDLEWDVTPGIQLAGHRFLVYTVIGMGYAWAHLDYPIYGFVGMTPMRITDSGGYTANIGFGAKYFLLEHLFVDFDARYRYVSKLVSDDGQSLNTAETTLSLGYRF
jgi:opacity protein-like surface antigen